MENTYFPFFYSHQLNYNDLLRALMDFSCCEKVVCKVKLEGWDIQDISHVSHNSRFVVSFEGVPLARAYVGNQFYAAGIKYLDLYKEQGVPANLFEKIFHTVQAVYKSARIAPEEQKKIKAEKKLLKNSEINVR